MTSAQTAKASREGLLRTDAEIRAAHPVSRIGVRSPALLEVLAREFRRDSIRLRGPRIPATVFDQARRDRMELTIEALGGWLSRFEFMGGVLAALRRERTADLKYSGDCPIAVRQKWFTAVEPWGILVRWVGHSRTGGNFQGVHFWPDFVILRVWEDGEFWECDELHGYPARSPLRVPDYQLYREDPRVKTLCEKLGRKLAGYRYTGNNPELARLRAGAREQHVQHRLKVRREVKAAIARADGEDIPFNLDRDPAFVASSPA